MQWRAVIGIVFALVVAVFAVVNVSVEPINYVFGVAHLPLVLIILGSALLGALAVAALGFVGRMRLLSENRNLRKSLTQMEEKLNADLAVSTASADAVDDPVLKSELTETNAGDIDSTDEDARRDP